VRLQGCRNVAILHVLIRSHCDFYCDLEVATKVARRSQSRSQKCRNATSRLQLNAAATSTATLRSHCDLLATFVATSRSQCRSLATSKKIFLSIRVYLNLRSFIKMPLSLIILSIFHNKVIICQ